MPIPTLTQKSLGGMPYWEMQIGAPTPEAPLVLALHWMTGDAAAMRFIFDGITKPLRVVTLQGRFPSGDPLGGYSWYTGELAFYDQSEDDQVPEIEAEAKRIAGFLRDYKALHSAPRTAVVGMSQGGDLTLALAMQHFALVDLAIPVAGRLPAALRPPSENLPASLPQVRLMHGVQDPIVPIASAREATAWLRDFGFDASLREYPATGHVIEPMAPDIRALLENF
jgi:phospholipase/carboxylesterase